jgi:hypothetical protein
MAKYGPKPKTLDIERVESVAAMGGTNEQIAVALRISEGTLFNIRKRDKAVDDAIKRGKEKADLLVIGALYKKAIAGDVTAMIFWLKNRQPDKWRDRHEAAFLGEQAVTVNITPVKKRRGDGKEGRNDEK